MTTATTAISDFEKWLRDEMKVSDEKSRKAIENEGLDDLDILLEFTAATIKILCETVRRPGGIDSTTNVAHAGNHISALSLIRLQQATYVANVYFRCQRTLSYERLSYNNIKRLYNIKTHEDQYEEPQKMDKPTKTFGIIKWIEAFDIYLQKYLGVRKIPLSYITRAATTVPNDDDDPINKYYTIHEEMINRADHSHACFNDDNAIVWSLIHDCLKDTPYYVSIRSYARNRDGRRAYNALCMHNLGSSKWDLIIQKAEQSMSHTVYTDEKLRFPFIKYISIHRDAYNDMVRTPNYNYPDESSRVRKMLNGIQSKDPAIIAAVINVQTSNTLSRNFEAAADAIQKCIKSKKITQTHRISMTQVRNSNKTTPNNRNNNNKQKIHKGKTGVELRYYKRKEYSKLNKEQRAELYQWQKSNKEDNNRKDDNDALTQKVAALSKQIEDNNKVIKDLEGKVKNNSSGETNSNNRALSRVTFATQNEE